MKYTRVRYPYTLQIHILRGIRLPASRFGLPLAWFHSFDPRKIGQKWPATSTCAKKADSCSRNPPEAGKESGDVALAQDEASNLGWSYFIYIYMHILYIMCVCVFFLNFGFFRSSMLAGFMISWWLQRFLTWIPPQGAPQSGAVATPVAWNSSEWCRLTRESVAEAAMEAVQPLHSSKNRGMNQQKYQVIMVMGLEQWRHYPKQY